MMIECVQREESKLNIKRLEPRILKPRILGEWLIIMRKLKYHCEGK